MEPVRIAVLGAGGWSRKMHRPALLALEAAGELQVVGVCDRDQTAAAAYAADFAGAPPTFTDLGELAAAVAPQGVALIVPPPITPEVVRAAVGLGLPFLCEKPPAPTAAVHRELVAAVGDLVHVVAYNRRHAPYLRQAREWLAGQRLQLVSGLMARHRRHDPDFGTTAVHAIDALRFLGGDWRWMRLEACRVGPAWNCFIDAWTVDGARVDLHVTPDTGSSEERYVVRGAERNVFVQFPQGDTADRPGFVERRHAGGQATRLGPADLGLDPDDEPLLGGMHGEYRAFAAALCGTAPSVSTLAATLQTQVVREAFSQAVTGDQPLVTVEQDLS